MKKINLEIYTVPINVQKKKILCIILVRLSRFYLAETFHESKWKFTKHL